MRGVSIFSRGPLTDALLDHLESTLSVEGVNLLVGDGFAPVQGGWTGGQPGAGSFKAYVVVGTGPATHNNRDPLSDPNSSWLANYTIRGVGGSRQQCDWAADKSRQAIIKFRPKGLNLGADGWHVLQSLYTGLGPVTRNDAADPPYWEVTDNVSLWMERS